MNFELNDETFTVYAMKHYDNPECKGVSDFEEDLKRFSYLKRLFRKDSNNGPRERLILNHLIVIFNLFGIEAATRMLFLKTDEEHWPQLKSFLVFLNYMPIGSISIRDRKIESYQIPTNQKILEVLGKI